MDNGSFGSLTDVLLSRAPMIMVVDIINEPITICTKHGPHMAKHCNTTHNCTRVNKGRISGLLNGSVFDGGGGG